MQTVAIEPIPEKKQKLIASAIFLTLKHGFSGTTLDMICNHAGVTKGSFFHYFANKEEIFRAAMAAWTGEWEAIVHRADFPSVSDPVERVFRLLDVMSACYMNPSIDIGCVVGMVAQETALSNESMRMQSAEHFETWLTITTGLLVDAKASCPEAQDFDPDTLARFLISMVQGSMLVAKTLQERPLIASNIGHCRDYLNTIFRRTPQ
jgi:TetR/AcrR family transcriptional repressor of nem operon